MYLLTSATSSSATALDEEFVPQFREFGLESTKVIIRGLVLLSWYDIMLLSLIIYHFSAMDDDGDGDGDGGGGGGG